MQPQQTQQPNFDFIMNPGKYSRKGGSDGPSKKQRIIIFVGGAALLLVATIIIGSLISAATGKASNTVIDLAAYQTELQRIVSLGNEKVRDSTLRNKSLTATYTLQSDIQLTQKMMTARGVKAPKNLATRYKSVTVDQALDAAEKSNSYDTAYQQIYTEKLTKYKAKLSEVYPLLNTKEKVLVKQQSDHAKLLLGETLASTK